MNVWYELKVMVFAPQWSRIKSLITRQYVSNAVQTHGSPNIPFVQSNWNLLVGCLYLNLWFKPTKEIYGYIEDDYCIPPKYYHINR